MNKPSVLPAEMTFVGQIEGDGDLVVFGRIDGPVHVSGALVIEAGALVRGHVHGRTVTVRGVLKGNAFGDESVRIDAGARLVGELTAPRVKVVPGARFRGQVHMTEVGQPMLSTYDPSLHTFAGVPAPTWSGGPSPEPAFVVPSPEELSAAPEPQVLLGKVSMDPQATGEEQTAASQDAEVEPKAEGKPKRKRKRRRKAKSAERGDAESVAPAAAEAVGSEVEAAPGGQPEEPKAADDGEPKAPKRRRSRRRGQGETASAGEATNDGLSENKPRRQRRRAPQMPRLGRSSGRRVQ